MGPAGDIRARAFLDLKKEGKENEVSIPIDVL